MYRCIIIKLHIIINVVGKKIRIRGGARNLPTERLEAPAGGLK